MFKTTLPKAVKKLQKELKEDLQLREGYKANIAMAFYDEYEDAMNNGVPQVKHLTLHKISNKAAERFLVNFCSQ